MRLAVVLLALLVLVIGLMFAAGSASLRVSDQNKARYKQACDARKGTVVYNGKHYECFVK